ncbi:phosphonatase-like hydrolase [Luteibacter rhizovicinus]|uniref:Phosphonatase-like hydrolase n=1 Tax=Luteibacter rhizovicinus TaxID=242606 RepID=A0A4R3YU01_9GAMM|nr:HAD hydrolase-like protein [Luteibacter rhizovicinus]TCV96031.1 phosphonatase-like hydrolase [Luteibacter rhizovicinus]
MAFELAVFDMAGTTVHDPDLVTQALTEALGAFGCQVSAAKVRLLMGYTKPAAIRSLLSEHDFAADDAQVDAVHADFVERMLHCYRNGNDVRPMAGAEDVFAQLRGAGIRVAVNTAFSRDIAETLIGRFGWRTRGLIDDATSADQVAEGRPAPDMIRQLMLRNGVTDPRRVVKVGDTEVDIREGRRAGCGLVIAVTTGAYGREQLEPYQPDALLDSLAELPPLLASFVPGQTR